ncbi:GNAT family N-acetyltransferase [Asanoa sp. NPDC050611]|uniref:GNAT family N-acetyltransferase n=1 Tax=Asanoa sp. NPDC050611 TaxID=3157098 RepID=UPI003407B41D
MSDLTRTAELVEAEVTYRLGEVAPEAARSALGVDTARIGGGVVISLRDDPAGGHFNRALALGAAEPVTDDLVAEVIDFHRQRDSPACHIQIAPDLLPDDWDAIVERHGLTRGDTTAKFVGEVDAVKPATTDLRVGPVEKDRLDEWAALVWELFEVPDPHLAAVTAAAARQDDFQAFGAWDGHHLVAVASVFTRGETAQFHSAATTATHRRRGIQSALISVRATYAAERGCRWVVSETDSPAVAGSNPSLNNMARAGLTHLYDRADWVWLP